MLAVTDIGKDGRCSITYTQINKSPARDADDSEGVTVCHLKRLRLTTTLAGDGRMAAGNDTAIYKRSAAGFTIEGKLGTIAFGDATLFRPLSRSEALSVWCHAINTPPLDLATATRDPEFNFLHQRGGQRRDKETSPREGLWISTLPSRVPPYTFFVAALTKTGDPLKSQLSRASIIYNDDKGTAQIRAFPTVEVVVTDGEIFQRVDQKTIPHFRCKDGLLIPVDRHGESEKERQYWYHPIEPGDAAAEPWGFAIDAPPLERDSVIRERMLLRDR